MRRIAGCLLSLCLSWTAGHAAPPQTLHYQGYLTSNAGAPVNGATQLTFKLYNAASGGSALWSETHPSVNVANGNYQVILGNATPIGLPFDAQYWLGLTAGTDEEMAPRQALTMVPYAYRAMTADGLAAGATVQGSQIAGAIAGAQVTGAISEATLAGSTLLQLQTQFAPSLFGSAQVVNTISTVDNGAEIGSVGSYRAIAIGADGFPVIAYLDYTNGDLKVAKCTNAECTGASTLTTVDTAGTVGYYVSIAIGADGLPIIAYTNLTGLDLKVAKCQNAACSGASTITTVDATGDVGRHASIAIGGDNLPVIAYYDATNLDLKVAKCLNGACTGSSTITTVDSIGSVGEYAELAIGADGLPVIAYFDGTNQDLKVAKCVDAACAGGSTQSIVDATVNINVRPSIAIGADGLPVLSYYMDLSDDLMVAKCANAACSGASTLTPVDTAGNVGVNSSIAVGADGLPIIAYQDWTNTSGAVLKVAKCVNPDCTGTSAIVAIPAAGAVGGFARSIAFGADGLPVIAHQQIIVALQNEHLKVAKCADAGCTGFSANTLVDAGAGGTEIVGLHTSIATAPDSRPVIAYYDSTNDDLKVAKCADTACSGPATITVVESAGNAGEYASIAIGTDGSPWISYYVSDGSDLKLARCTSPTCSTRQIRILDTDGNAGRFSSIAIGADGFPVVSYSGGTAGLKLARCSNATCSSSSVTVVDATAASIGEHTSIAIGLDGFPVISYSDPSADNLKVAKCGNAACSAGNTLSTVDFVGEVGEFTSIAVGPDGLPVVSYYDRTNGDLKVAKCGNAACSAGNTITVVDATGDVGQYTSITLGADGLPLVSYYDVGASALKLAKCISAACTGATVLTTLDSVGAVGQYSAISIGQGWPVISYYNATAGALKVLKCSSPYCAPFMRAR